MDRIPGNKWPRFGVRFALKKQSLFLVAHVLLKNCYKHQKMNLNTFAQEMTSIFDVDVSGNTLGALYQALKQGAEKSSLFSLHDADAVPFMDLDDGGTTGTRSIIRGDTTYHSGQVLDTLGALKDSKIELGKDTTSLEVCLTDPKGQKWIVHTTWWASSEDFAIDMVKCPPDMYEYIWQDQCDGWSWSPRDQEDPRMLFNLIRSM
jgi:hypothetical protein